MATLPSAGVQAEEEKAVSYRASWGTSAEEGRCTPSTGVGQHKPPVAPGSLGCRLLPLLGTPPALLRLEVSLEIISSHRLLEAGLATAGCPQPVQVSFEYLQGWRLHSSVGKPFQGLTVLAKEKRVCYI